MGAKQPKNASPPSAQNINYQEGQYYSGMKLELNPQMNNYNSGTDMEKPQNPSLIERTCPGIPVTVKIGFLLFVLLVIIAIPLALILTLVKPA